jgi:lipopolysaccharide transport system permease protein
MNTAPPPTTHITSRGLTSLTEWRELWAGRDLARFIVQRDLKTRYAQSVLGLGWAVVQPLFTTFVLTLIFGVVAGLSSDGVPYPVWSLTGVVAWTFFQTGSNEVGNCLAVNINVVSKVYFPRLVLPLAAIACRTFDLLIMLTLLVIALVVEHKQLLLAGCHLQLSALWALPASLAVAALAALAVGLWLAGLSVRYRDVRVAQGLMFQLLMYAVPVIYPSSLIYTSNRIPSWITPAWRDLYFLNPMADVIETLRACLFGTTPVIGGYLVLGAAVSLAGLLSGLWCFRRAENIMTDVA